MKMSKKISNFLLNIIFSKKITIYNIRVNDIHIPISWPFSFFYFSTKSIVVQFISNKSSFKLSDETCSIQISDARILTGLLGRRYLGHFRKSFVTHGDLFISNRGTMSPFEKKAKVKDSRVITLCSFFSFFSRDSFLSSSFCPDLLSFFAFWW